MGPSDAARTCYGSSAKSSQSITVVLTFKMCNSVWIIIINRGKNIVLISANGLSWSSV